MPLANNLKNIMLNENVDIKVIDKIKKLGHSISFNETFFVCAEGDNTDGSSWEHAYTDIQTALDAASTDSDKCALILLSPIAGTTRYDINTTGDPTWTGNYAIVGIARHFASIKNSHASATSTLKFTGNVYLANFSIYMNTDNNGIIIGANGSEIHRFNSDGKYLGNLIGLGQGPGEFLNFRSLHAFFVSNQIFVAGTSKLARFKKSGDFISEKKIGQSPDIFVDESRFFMRKREGKRGSRNMEWNVLWLAT